MLSIAAGEQGSAFLGRFIVYFNSVCPNVCLKCKEKKRSTRALEAYSRLARRLPFLGWFIVYWSHSTDSFPGKSLYFRLRPPTEQYAADGDHNPVDY